MNAGAIAALLSSVTWAIAVTTYARLSFQHSGSAVNATRALVAAPLFAIVVLLECGGLAGAAQAVADLGSLRLGMLALSMLTSFALGDVIFMHSANALGVPAAMSIASAYPLWASLGGNVFRGERLSLLRMGGVLAVVAGTVVVIAAGAPAPQARGSGAGSSTSIIATSICTPSARTRLRGVALAIAASLLWALNSVAVGAGSHGASIGAVTVTRMTMGVVLCPLVGVILRRTSGAQGDTGRFFLPLAVFRGAWWVFLTEAFGGAFLFTYGLGHAPLAVAATLSSLAPVLVVPLAVFSGAERFSTVKTTGILVVVLGVFLLVR